MDPKTTEINNCMYASFKKIIFYLLSKICLTPITLKNLLSFTLSCVGRIVPFHCTYLLLCYFYIKYYECLGGSGEGTFVTKWLETIPFGPINFYSIFPILLCWDLQFCAKFYRTPSGICRIPTQFQSKASWVYAAPGRIMVWKHYSVGCQKSNNCY